MHSEAAAAFRSALVPRVVPFVVFLLLTSAQAWFGKLGPFVFYPIKTVLAVGMIVWMVPRIPELRLRLSFRAIGAGVLVFLLWVGLDGHYPRLSEPGKGWDPNGFPGGSTSLGPVFFWVHALGMTLVVPPLEEVFYRSFLYRYLIRESFLSVELNTWQPKAFFVTALVFGLVHPDRWLAGILCGLIYQALVVRSGRLGDAIVAHAVTNGLLAGYIGWNKAWSFW